MHRACADAYNLTLSKARVASVAMYLCVKGINASRLQVRGYGETQTISDNETKVERLMNRRVVLRILNQE